MAFERHEDTQRAVNEMNRKELNWAPGLHPEESIVPNCAETQVWANES